MFTPCRTMPHPYHKPTYIPSMLFTLLTLTNLTNAMNTGTVQTGHIPLSLQQFLLIQPLVQHRDIFLFFISFIVILFGILFSRLLVRKQILSPTKEKIIWNVLLLVFFFPSAITGILLVFTPVFPILYDINITSITLHTCTSFFLIWIIAYHILWHSTYYLKQLNFLKHN